MPQPANKKPASTKNKKKNANNLHNWFFGINVTLSVIRRFALFLVAFFLLIGALTLGIGVGYFAFLVSDTTPPTKEELTAEINDFSEVSHIVYSGGENIATISSDLIRTYASSENISPYLKNAIIATEDENFEEHDGIVPKALARAVISDVTGLGGSSGGSTLTQQLVKQQILTSETTFKRKANEILLALRVDKYFSKDEIITAYLNVSPFGRNNKGQNIAGVEEAAKGIFGVSAKDVTLAQAAFIAGLPQSPITYNPYNSVGEIKDAEFLATGLKRKDNVLFSMLREKVITQEEYDAAMAEDLTQQFIPQAPAEQITKDFLYYTVEKQAIEILMEKNYTKDNLKKEDVIADDALYNQYYETAQRELQRKGYTVHTTIDKTIQDTLNVAVSDYGYILDDGRGAYVENGGVLMDNHTGRVYGFIAGRDFSKSQNNHAFSTKRPPGSTIKPVLAYGPAFDVGLVGTETKLSNFQTFYKEEPSVEIWNAGVPPDNTFHTVADSLRSSLNIPTYHLYQALLQVKDPAEYMTKMEYDVDVSEYHHESSPLGQMDMTVFDQTKGFATLANGGTYNRGYLIDSITDTQGNVIYQYEGYSTQVYTPETAAIMNSLMKNVFTQGTGRTAYYALSDVNSTLANADWAVKTGTTTDNKDFWFIGSTPGITFSSWIGYDDGTQMVYTNSQNNQKYWSYVMNRVYNASPTIFEVEASFAMPDTVKKVEVSDVTGEKIKNFTYNGKTYVTPGSKVTSLYATGDGQDTTYEFGIGGTPENYATAWKDKLKVYSAPKNPSTTPSSSSSESSSSSSSSSSSEETQPSSEETPASSEATETPAA